MQPSKGQPHPPKPPSFAQRPFSQIAAQGSFWSLISSVVSLLSGLITAPFFLKTLGEANYGALILIGVVIAYAEIADLGISLSSIRHASAALRAGEYTRFYEILGTAWLLHGSAGLFSATTVWLLAPWIMETLFHLPSQLLPDAVKALQISAVNFGLVFAIGIPQLVPTIVGRFDLYNKLSAFRVIGRAVIGLGVVSRGGGLVGLTYGYLFLEGLIAILTLLLARHLLPEMPKQLRFHANAVRQLFRLGRIITLNGILVRILNQWEKTLLGRYVGSATLPYYNIPHSITSQFVLIPGALGGSLLAELSGLYAKGDLPAATRLLARSQQIAYLILFAITAFLGMCTFDLLSLWIGEHFAKSATATMHILLLGGLLQSMNFLYHISLSAQGKPNRITWTLLGVGIIHLPLSFYLVQTKGAYGASWALTLRYALELIGIVLLFPEGVALRSLRSLFSQASAFLLVWSVIWGLGYMTVLGIFPLLLRVAVGAIVFWGGWAYIMYRWGLYPHELESLLKSLPIPNGLRRRLLPRA